MHNDGTVIKPGGARSLILIDDANISVESPPQKHSGCLGSRVEPGVLSQRVSRPELAPCNWVSVTLDMQHDDPNGEAL